MTFPAPPLDSAILFYPPFFPNGTISADWSAYFTALQNTLVSGPVTSFNGRFGVVVPVSGDYPASLVPFTQVGTGAVASTVDAKLDESVSVLDFGADATGVANSDTAFADAIATGKRVFVPKGTYLLTGQTLTSQSFEIFGEGRASVLNYNTTGVGIQLTQASSVQRITGYIHDLAFAQTTNVPSAFIRNTGYLNLLIERCYFSDTSATYCVDNYKGYGLRVSHCVFSDVTGSGIRYRDDGAVNYYSYAAALDNCDFTRLSGDGLDIEGCKDLGIVNCVFESITGDAIKTNSNGGSTSILSWNVNLYSVYFESITGYALNLTTDGSTYYGKANLVGCSFNTGQSVNLGSKSKILFIGCSMGSTSAYVTIVGSASAAATLIGMEPSTWSQSGSFNLTQLNIDGTATLPGTVNTTGTLNMKGAANNVGDGTSTAVIKFNALAGSERDIYFQTAGVLRWLCATHIGTESGSNAGSNFRLQAYGDTGTLIDTVLSIARAAGSAAVWSRTQQITDTTDATSPGNGSINTAGGISCLKNMVIGGYLDQAVGTAVASAATITPTGPVFHITGTAAISTINLPYTGFTGTLRIIADGAWSTTTAGNIGTAIIAVANQEYAFTYDGTKWYATSYGTNTAVASSTPSAPTGTTSLTGVMMGLNLPFTPVKTGRVRLTISAQISNNTANDGTTLKLRYGTGTAPVNGAASTGTQVGPSQSVTFKTAGDSDGVTIDFPVTTLAVGTAYWLDCSLASVTGGTSTVFNIGLVAQEF